jgi:hypothetical protein
MPSLITACVSAACTSASTAAHTVATSPPSWDCTDGLATVLCSSASVMARPVANCNFTQ